MLKAILLSDEQIKKYGEYMTDISALKSSGLYTNGITLSMSDEAMETDVAVLRETAAQQFTVDNSGFATTVERDKKSLVFFSVPYDEGWTATVNGKAVTVERVNEGFMAVAVDEGTSEIRFNYKNTGLGLGVGITLCAAFLFILYILISGFYMKQHPCDTVYPEGDQLLESWGQDESQKEEINEGSSLPLQNALDIVTKENTFEQNSEFSGGFTINPDALDVEENNET